MSTTFTNLFILLFEEIYELHINFIILFLSHLNANNMYQKQEFLTQFLHKR